MRDAFSANRVSVKMGPTVLCSVEATTVARKGSAVEKWEERLKIAPSTFDEHSEKVDGLNDFNSTGELKDEATF